MTKFKAKVTQDIPANRLVALGGINTEDNPEEGWETVYLIPSKRGWIPDLVSTSDLEKDSVVNVTIKNNPVWKVEASQNLPAGTLVQCDDDGRAKNYTPADGNHIGYTTHSAKEGEVVEVVRKYGNMPQNQVETSAFSGDDFKQVDEPEKDLDKLTNDELKELLNEKEIEYNSKATKKELIALLGGD